MRDYNQLVKKARASLQWMKQPDSTYQEDIVTMAAVVDALEVAEREVRRLEAAATATPPVAGSKTAAQLLKSRRDAGLTAADIPKSYSTSTKTELLALMGTQNERLEFFEVAADIDLRYYDGGTEIDVDKLADKLVTWLAEHDRQVGEAAVLDYVTHKEVGRVLVLNQSLLDAAMRAAGAKALNRFADNLRVYTLNHASTTALLDHVVSLAHRDADLAGA